MRSLRSRRLSWGRRADSSPAAISSSTAARRPIFSTVRKRKAMNQRTRDGGADRHFILQNAAFCRRIRLGQQRGLQAGVPASAPWCVLARFSNTRCQRRSKNASLGRRKNTSMMLVRRPGIGCFFFSLRLGWDCLPAYRRWSGVSGACSD